MTEAALQTSIIAYLRVLLPDAIVAAVLNGGSRVGGAREGYRLKRAGVLAGFPDLVLFPGDGRAFVFEVKTDKGRVSPEQRQVMDRLHHLGIGGAVVRSVEDVRIALKAWGIRTREAGQ